MCDIALGLRQEWLLDNRINAYTVTVLNELILSRWAESVIDVLGQWSPADGPYLTLYDISAPRVGIPYLVQARYNIHKVGVTDAGQYHVASLVKEQPGLRIYMALILSDSSSGGITAKKAREGAYEHTESQVFFHREAGLDWLQSILHAAR